MCLAIKYLLNKGITFAFTWFFCIYSAFRSEYNIKFNAEFS